MRDQGVASVEVDGKPKSALDLYRDGLDLRRTIVRDFGFSPEALRDVMVSHSILVVLAFDANDLEQACNELETCSELVAEIEARGWATTQTLSDRAWLDSVNQQLGCDAGP